MRNLAHRSGEIAADIIENVVKANEKFKHMAQKSSSNAEIEGTLTEATRQHIDDVTRQHEETQHARDEAAGKLSTLSSSITSEIESALVSLQFQDRVSQILDHVRANMTELSEMIKNQENLDIEQFLEKIASEYTTTSEREAHRKLTGTVVLETPKESNESDVVFF